MPEHRIKVNTVWLNDSVDPTFPTDLTNIISPNDYAATMNRLNQALEYSEGDKKALFGYRLALQYIVLL